MCDSQCFEESNHKILDVSRGFESGDVISLQDNSAPLRINDAPNNQIDGRFASFGQTQ